ncbi:hypothetical protein QZM22_13480 [Burkholderia oklahomensis]|uniref:hypothetical protein n=1 Tax=Burkholderia oklahomensis TaxID=342113 RepID=UPI00264DF620|nr:hypothetical protein [Burkholderia oklahomensis]MDN7673503.1 hypothetical protein [Burkholderia oklahomensis]
MTKGAPSGAPSSFRDDRRRKAGTPRRTTARRHRAPSIQTRSKGTRPSEYGGVRRGPPSASQRDLINSVRHRIEMALADMPRTNSIFLIAIHFNYIRFRQAV